MPAFDSTPYLSELPLKVSQPRLPTAELSRLARMTQNSSRIAG
ncbi:hypothetical protein RA8CHR_01946 [Variovorax sp. RA8]|nr:hypothetical protein RA8CHR_01946 [Variovorax sp. RA8]